MTVAPPRTHRTATENMSTKIHAGDMKNGSRTHREDRTRTGESIHPSADESSDTHPDRYCMDDDT